MKTEKMRIEEMRIDGITEAQNLTIVKALKRCKREVGLLKIKMRQVDLKNAVALKNKVKAPIETKTAAIRVAGADQIATKIVFKMKTEQRLLGVKTKKMITKERLLLLSRMSKCNRSRLSFQLLLPNLAVIC